MAEISHARNNKEEATDALQTAYYEAVRKRVPYRLNFSPDGQRLVGVSKSGQETIFDARTGKPLRPISRGEQDGDDQPATALELKSEGKEALGNGALAFETPESREAVSKLAADRDSNCFVTTKNGATYMWFGTPDKMAVGVEVNHICVSTRKSLLILNGNSMLPPRMRKLENVRVYLPADPNE